MGRGKPTGRLRVGTSGWAYPWSDFYATVAPRQRLAHYARCFDTVEVNTTFYHLPRPSSYETWARETPEGFEFALKASRYITHVKRLLEVREAWRTFLAGARLLGEKLGPVLLQLPPSMRAQPERLDRFLEHTAALRQALDLTGLRIAVEARHGTWFESPEVLQALRRHGAALAFPQSSRFPYPEAEPVTAGFVYLRLHGPREWCASLYGPEELEAWASKTRAWLRAGLDVSAYFNNDVHGYAPRDARCLVEELAPA